MRTQYYTACSVDGFIAAPDHSLLWRLQLGDELIVQVGSVTLDAGRPLLPRQIAFPPMRLISVQQFGPGFAERRYALPDSAGADQASRTSPTG
jgi:dihydrofolate reductase